MDKKRLEQEIIGIQCELWEHGQRLKKGHKAVESLDTVIKLQNVVTLLNTVIKAIKEL